MKITPRATAIENVGSRNRAGSTIGWSTARSTSANPPALAMPAASSASVGLASHPWLPAMMKPPVSAAKPTVARMWPRKVQWVEVPRRFFDMTAQQFRGDGRDREVDKEDRAPAEGGSEDAAEDGSGGQADTRRATPQAKRATTLAVVGKHMGNQRQRAGHQRCGAGALDQARDDQRGQGGRAGTGCAAQPEDAQADQEPGAQAEAVGQRPGRQQQRRERQGVTVDDPLRRRQRTAEVGADRPQRDVDDRRVEGDHQKAQRDSGKPERAATPDRPVGDQLHGSIVRLGGAVVHDASGHTNRRRLTGSGASRTATARVRPSPPTTCREDLATDQPATAQRRSRPRLVSSAPIARLPRGRSVGLVGGERGGQRPAPCVVTLRRIVSPQLSS